MKKCRSRNGEIGMEKWGKEGKGNGEMGTGGIMEMGKWRWRNGNQDEKEVETSAEEKWKKA